MDRKPDSYCCDAFRSLNNAQEKMQRPVSSYAFAPSVKVKLLNAGFQSSADLCDSQPFQLSKGKYYNNVLYSFTVLLIGKYTVSICCTAGPFSLFDADAGISQEEAVEVLQAVKCDSVQEREAVEKLTALELLQKEQELGNIVTFCSALDMALGGGLPVGKVTEVCGAPGIGKTQLW